MSFCWTKIGVTPLAVMGAISAKPPHTPLQFNTAVELQIREGSQMGDFFTADNSKPYKTLFRCKLFCERAHIVIGLVSPFKWKDFLKLQLL